MNSLQPSKVAGASCPRKCSAFLLDASRMLAPLWPAAVAEQDKGSEQFSSVSSLLSVVTLFAS